MIPQCKSLLVIPLKEDRSLSILYTQGLIERLKEKKQFRYIGFDTDIPADQTISIKSDNALFKRKWVECQTHITIIPEDQRFIVEHDKKFYYVPYGILPNF